MKILEESFKEGAIPHEVATKYGIPAKTLHNWRSKYKSQQKSLETASEKAKNCRKDAGEFVEVHLQNTEDVAGSKLQGVSFNFTDYVVQISGKIDDRIIGSILKISGIN